MSIGGIFKFFRSGRTEAPRKRNRTGQTKKKPDSVVELLGFALSVLGLSYDDFCRLEMREFTACCRAYNEHRSAELHDAWERMRLLATIVIQPHVKGKVSPQKLLPFDWEKTKKKAPRVSVSKEEDKNRFEALAKGFYEL